MSEHVFVDEKSKSPETNGIRIIDFDAATYISKEIKIMRKSRN